MYLSYQSVNDNFLEVKNDTKAVSIFINSYHVSVQM